MANKHTDSKPAGRAPSASIHPRRPRLTDLKVEVPKDSDGAYRATRRLDGKILNIPKIAFSSGGGQRVKKEDGAPSSFVSE